MKVWADANACSGEPQQYFTKFDGDTELWCVHPHGANCVHAVVRCSHSLGHTYPFGKSNAQRRASVRHNVDSSTSVFFVNSKTLMECTDPL